MAQKREKEETELKLPNTISVCVPAIPVSSQLSGAADDLTAPSSVRSSESSDLKVSDAVESRSGAARSPERPDLVVSRPKMPEGKAAGEAEDPENRSLKRPREVTRCSGNGCRRKVGLIGIRCRCGEVFCSEHRYSDRHDCTFDYKAAGREAIARENPVVRAAKILKV